MWSHMGRMRRFWHHYRVFRSGHAPLSEISESVDRIGRSLRPFGYDAVAASNGIVQTDKENQEKGTDSIENERTAQRNERKAWRNKKSERSRTDEKAAPLAFCHESMYT